MPKKTAKKMLSQDSFQDNIELFYNGNKIAGRWQRGTL